MEGELWRHCDSFQHEPRYVEAVKHERGMKMIPFFMGEE